MRALPGLLTPPACYAADRLGACFDSSHQCNVRVVRRAADTFPRTPGPGWQLCSRYNHLQSAKHAMPMRPGLTGSLQPDPCPYPSTHPSIFPSRHCLDMRRRRCASVARAAKRQRARLGRTDGHQRNTASVPPRAHLLCRHWCGAAGTRSRSPAQLTSVEIPCAADGDGDLDMVTLACSDAAAAPGTVHSTVVVG